MLRLLAIATALLSVLTNILDVPGKNQQRDSVLTEYAQRRTDGWQLILPLTAVLETGNHIAHIKDLTILVERERYRARVAGGSVVEVWTLDTALGAFS